MHAVEVHRVRALVERVEVLELHADPVAGARSQQRAGDEVLIARAAWRVAAYEAYRARGVMKDGRRFGRPPNAYVPPAVPEGRINVTDPDSRLVKTMRGHIQGYNAQAVTNARQIVIAAEVMTASPDFGHLEPMLNAAERELRRAGVSARPDTVLADAGYWHQGQMERLVAAGTQVLIPPRLQPPQGKPTGMGRRPLRFHAPRPGDRPWQRALPTTPTTHRAGVHQHQVQPRHRPLPPTRQIRRPTEWRLISATHNLLKLHKHHTATA
jgi:hypothetical protein